MTHINSHTHKNTQKHFWLKNVVWAIFIIYIILLIYVTLFAWNYGSSYGPVGPGGRNYNLIPLKSIYNISTYSPSLIDPISILGGNIIMFFPFGILSSLLLKQKRKALWVVPLLSILLSSLIEVNQFIFTHRVSNIDDVLLNTLGGLLGTWSTLIILWLTNKIKNRIIIIK